MNKSSRLMMILLHLSAMNVYSLANLKNVTAYLVYASMVPSLFLIYYLILLWSTAIQTSKANHTCLSLSSMTRSSRDLWLLMLHLLNRWTLLPRTSPFPFIGDYTRNEARGYLMISCKTAPKSPNLSMKG